MEQTAHHARIRSARRRLENEGPAVQRHAGDFRTVSLPAVYGNALRDVLVEEAASSVIEIGLAYGSSALAIAEALAARWPSDTKHLIIDAYQDHFHDAGWRLLVDTGVADTCSLVRESSQYALPHLATQGLVADAALVDGSHLFHNVFVDLFFLREVLRPGGIVVLDDCHWASVAAAVRYFELHCGWKQRPMPEHTRLRAYRLPTNPTELPLTDFQPFTEPPPTTAARSEPHGAAKAVTMVGHEQRS
jgi:predicted O-methyltransferase YrrM